MLKYKEILDELKIDVANKYYDLLEQRGEFDFVKRVLIQNDIDPENGDYQTLIEADLTTELPIIEMRDSFTGAVSDVYPTLVTKDGIHCVNVNEDDIRYLIRFDDVASIDYQIILLTEMDNEFC